MDKKISIILSTYNEASVIEHTISEIFKHVTNVEIILPIVKSDTTYNNQKNTYTIELSILLDIFNPTKIIPINKMIHVIIYKINIV